MYKVTQLYEVNRAYMVKCVNLFDKTENIYRHNMTVKALFLNSVNKVHHFEFHVTF